MKKYSNKWLNHFARHARAARDKSKDTTKVGAVLIGENNETLLTAYNDHAIGIIDREGRRSRENGKKYRFASHAERNIISFAARHGLRLEGLTIYSTHFPCCDCANAIVQAGIKCVIVGSGEYVSGTDDIIADSNAILSEGKVQVINHFDEGELLERADALVKAFLFHKKDSAGVSLYYHCKEVMENLGADAPLNYKLAALLHDIIEDSDGIITYDTLIAMGFPEDVAETVDICTIKPGENYSDYFDRLIASRNFKAYVVKFSDNYSNMSLRRLALLPEDKQQYFIKRYTKPREQLLYVLKTIEMHPRWDIERFHPYFLPMFGPLSPQ